MMNPNRDGVSNLICIYCKKSGVSFNREHVIPEAFGRFDSNNLVLHDTVCQDCNTFFSRELEYPFSRGSYEAVQRFNHGLKEYSKGDEIRWDRVEFVIPEGEFKGARLHFDASSDDRPCMRWHPQAGFKRALGAGRQFFLLRELQGMSSFDNNSFVKNEARAILLIDNSQDERDEILAEFSRLGIKYKNGLKAVAPESMGVETTLEIRGTVDRISARTIAKIAFNYMAYVLGAERCLHPDFDAAREFIRNGTEPGYRIFRPSRRPILASDSERWRRTDGHLITLDAITGWTQILVRVSLFNTITYEILLCPRLSGPIFLPISSGHHFDVRNNTISELGKYSQPIGLILTTPQFKF